MHNVDEDRMTIVRCGGRWDEDPESKAGVTFRIMTGIPTESGGNVASVQKKINRTYSPRGDACSIDERQSDFMLTV